MSSRRMPSPRPNIAAIYCRVSGAGQEDNASLPTQEAACRAYVLASGYAVDEAYVIREVHTAAELWQRPKLTALRAALRQGTIGAVVCYALDRLSRKQTHLAIIVDECERAGVELLFVTEEFERSAVGDFIRSAKAFAAELEREKIKERMQRGLQARIHSGKPVPGCRALFGYRWRDEAKSGLIVDETTAPIVRRIFAAIVAGQTLAQIARDLNAEGIPTPTGKAHWHRSALHAIVKHPHYTGQATALRYATHKDIEGVTHLTIRDALDQIALPEGTCPALIDPATYEAVQERLRHNKASSPGRTYDPQAFLLRGGYVRCGHCGRAVSAKWYPGRHDERVPNYTLMTGHRGCPHIAIRATILDRAVWSHVEDLLHRPEIIAQELARLQGNDPTAADLAAIERAAQEVERKRGNLVRRLALFDDEESAAPVVEAINGLGLRARELAAERAAVQERRAAWEAAGQRLADIERWCRDVAVRLGELTYDQKRLALDALGVAVKLYEDGHSPRYEITASIPFDGSTTTSLYTTRSR